MIRLLQFILAISLLVLLHEAGHMILAKLFGVKVEKFFVFFDVRIGKWSGKLFSFKPRNDDTEYGLGWLPLGGYTKIAGMIDESFDTEQMKQPPQDWEFRCKPAWQRLLIMIGGVTVNFFLALFIYAMVLFHWGESYISMKDMNMGMVFNTEAKALGFQDHDILIGTEKRMFKGLTADVYRDLSEAKECHVLRNGKKVTIPMPGDLNLLNMLKTTPVFAMPYVPSEVDSVIPNTPAAELGIKKGDRIVAINGKSIDSWNEFRNQISRLSDAMTGAKTRKDSLAIRNISLSFTHKGDTASVIHAGTLLNPELQLGVGMTSVFTYYQPTTTKYGFFASLPAGAKYGWNILKGYVNDFKYVFTSDGMKSLGGFGAIGSLFPPTWDWHMFWLMTAFLSIILAFMNLLPIPALDGGHVVFLAYEMITGKKPSEKFMITAEYIGVGILILLFVVANLNDILRWIGVI